MRIRSVYHWVGKNPNTKASISGYIKRWFWESRSSTYQRVLELKNNWSSDPDEKEEIQGCIIIKFERID